MDIRELMHGQVAAMVEFYDNSPACDEANRLTEEVKTLMGPDAPVYRINVDEQPRERSLVHIDTLPVIIIYRNHREEWRITSDFPDAATLAQRLRSSMDAPGAVNPLKGHPRYSFWLLRLRYLTM